MVILSQVIPQRIFILKFLLAIEAEMVIRALSVVRMELRFRVEDLLRDETSNMSYRQDILVIVTYEEY